MHFAFINDTWTTQLLRTISWTLVHALWQGAAAALVAALLLALTRQRPPALRYALLLGTLGIFVAGVFLTFFLQGDDVATAHAASAAASGLPVTLAASSSESLLARLSGFLDDQAGFIVLCWLFVGGLRFIHLLAGMEQVRRLGSRQVVPASAFWNDRLRHLAGRLAIKKPVRLLQSALVQAPVVINYFKPAILLPMGLLTALPQDEIEAILLHELAHIRRKDFLVNLLQHLVETLFFFHPLVLWISARIREEREHCCDDVALLRLDDKTTLVRAMIACRELSIAGAPLALGFGTKNQLLHRARRILGRTARPFHAREKLIVGLCAPIGILLLMFLFQGFRPATALNAAPHYDTIPSPKTKMMNQQDETTGTVETVNSVQHDHYTFRRQGILYEVEAVKGTVISLSIDGNIVPAERMADELPAVRRMIEEYHQITTTPFTGLSTLQSGKQELAAPRSEAAAEPGGLAPLKVSTTGLQTEHPAQAEAPQATTLYGNGYKIIMRDGVVHEAYYKEGLLSGDELSKRQADIDAVVRKHRSIRL